MKHRYHLGRKLVALMLVLFMFASTALAAEVRVDSPDGLALGAEVFSESEALEGVYFASVPSSLDAELTLGGRTLRAGDVLDRTMLSQLRVKPAANRDSGCELVYFPIENGEVLPSRALSLSILTGKNEAPVCRDVKLETYKNIANTGALDARDPEGDTLTYQLVKEPKRGTVELSPDGSFTYTPAHNKVGRDSFVYTATDPAGNVSNEARVKIKIVKPTDAATFADLAGDPLEYRAMALKDMGVYGGRQIAGQLCFAPDETVSRGEFLVMAMRVLGMEPDAAVLTSGFADEAATAAWMRPYITAAYRSGVISGVSAETGIEFRPDAALTKAECAVMLQNMLDLPQPDTQPVFSVEEGECIASWAVPSASALQSAGLELTPLADGTLTRRECAELLYQLSTLCQQDVLENFRWDS